MARKVYIHKVVVTGDFQFPIDMLRYDGLHPQSESDSGMIHATFRPGGTHDKVHVNLSRWAEKDWHPTDARWRSFSWKVVEHTLGHAVND